MVVVSVVVSVLVAGEDAVVVSVDSVFVTLLVEGATADALMDFLFSALGGLTIVVLFSVFFSGGAAGATVSVFCSHAPRSAALARMQINFFIVVWISCPSWD